MTSRLLVDNDVLIKLAHWGLLDQLPNCFDLDWPQVSALSSLQFRAARGDTKLFRAREAADVLSQHLSRTGEIPAGDAADISRLQGVVDLDAGEIELVAACLADPEAMMVSGDKRALQALANTCPPDIAARLSGRVVCLEQLLAMIARRTSCSTVIHGVLLCRELDSAVRAVIGPQGCSDVQFLEGMSAYITHLRTRTAMLLHPD